MASKKSATKKSKTAAKKPTAGKRGRKAGSLTFKDVQIAFLQDGVAGLKRCLEKSVGKLTFRNALSDFKKSAASAGMTETFERWMVDTFGAPNAGRGRPKVTSGAKRAYKAQQVGDGEPFLRLPLSVLGINKGETVTVSFDRDLIRVSKQTGGQIAG